MTERKRPLAALGAFLALALSTTPALAIDAVPQKTTGTPIAIETLATGLEHPWSVEALPDGGFIVTERPGRLRIVRDGKLSAPLSGLPEIRASGQGGLMDLALAPDFTKSRRLYFTAAIPGPGGQGTAVFAARLAENEKGLTQVTRLFAMNKFTGKGQHFGSRIAIAADGTLFFGIGDRGDRDRAQDGADHAGSILRINTDGSAPSGNGGFAASEIWSIGHRNPQGLTFDPADGTLYSVEHGARGGDEINTPKAGRNYGWPVITYGRDYTGFRIGVGTAKDGLEQPLHYWDPSIAPGAIAVYRGAMFPEWDGDFLVAALKFELLSRLDRDASGKVAGEERLLRGEYGRIRDVTVAPDGAVLMVTDEAKGALLRLYRPAGG